MAHAAHGGLETPSRRTEGVTPLWSGNVLQHGATCSRSKITRSELLILNLVHLHHSLYAPSAPVDEDDEELAGLKGRLVKRKEHAGEEDGTSCNLSRDVVTSS